MWLPLRVQKPNHHRANWISENVMRLYGYLLFNLFFLAQHEIKTKTFLFIKYIANLIYVIFIKITCSASELI